MPPIFRKTSIMVATVVFMFLMPRYVPDVIANMKEHTNPGGYNLIVSAMDTEDFPCPMLFPFKFGEGELREYYKGIGNWWNTRKSWVRCTRKTNSAIRFSLNSSPCWRRNRNKSFTVKGRLNSVFRRPLSSSIHNPFAQNHQVCQHGFQIADLRQPPHSSKPKR